MMLEQVLRVVFDALAAIGVLTNNEVNVKLGGGAYRWLLAAVILYLEA